MLALLAGMGVSTWQAVRANREAERATQAEHMAGEELYAASMVLAQGAWEGNNINRLRGLLEETCTFPNRGFEWYYWQRLAHLDLRTLHGHTGGIAAVAYSPDGRWILTGSTDKTAKVWDAESGRELRTRRADETSPQEAGLAPDRSEPTCQRRGPALDQAAT